MEWSNNQIRQHKEAARLLDKIKDEAIEYIRKNNKIREHEVQQFILKKFDEYGLVNEIDRPIVAFNENTSIIHHYPSENSKELSDDALILIDIWAKLTEEGAPYADITWMAYKGKKVSEEIQEAFDTVIRARDLCIEFIKKELKSKHMPLGREAHQVVCDYFSSKGVLDVFFHSTGHSLSAENVHGQPPYLSSKKGDDKLLLNMGYTIEPGLYFKGRFGIRSEMDFYVDSNYRFVETTNLQKEIVYI